MCNRARFRGEHETLFAKFGASWAPDVVRPNRDPQELFPKAKAYVVRHDRDKPVVDVMSWDVLGGGAKWPMTNVRNLKLPQWRALAAEPANRCLIPLTEFCEWTPETHQVGEGKPVKGEMWFDVTDQPVFAVAGFWQVTAKGPSFAMVTCDPNELVAPARSSGRTHGRRRERGHGPAARRHDGVEAESAPIMQAPRLGAARWRRALPQRGPYAPPPAT